VIVTSNGGVMPSQEKTVKIKRSIRKSTRKALPCTAIVAVNL
jgi:hypothetical protein